MEFCFVEAEAQGTWRQFLTRGLTFELFQARTGRLNTAARGKGQAFHPSDLIK